MSTNSDVSISITVVDKDGTKSIVQLQGAIQGLGPAAGKAGDEAGAGLDKIGGHALTNLDNVRLLRDDLGIHLPRSMEKAIASSALLSGWINAMGEGLLGLGAIDIFVNLTAGAERAYEKLFDVSKAIDEYTSKAGLAATHKLFDDASLETSLSLIKQTSAEVEALQQKRVNAGADTVDGGWLQYFQSSGSPGDFSTISNRPASTPSIFSAKDDASQATSAANRDVAQQRTHSLQLQYDHERLQNQAEYDSAATRGWTQISEKLKDALKLADNDLAATKQKEALLVSITTQMAAQQQIEIQSGKTIKPEDLVHIYQADPHAGETVNDIAVKKAQQDASAAYIALKRDETTQVIQMQNEALSARLSGNSLYAAQEQQAIEAVFRKFQEGEISKQAEVAETAAIHAKYDNEALRRQDELDARVRKAASDAATAGLTGIARIQAETAAAIQAIDDEEQKAVGRGGVETSQQKGSYSSLRASASGAGNQKQLEAETQFYEELRQLGENYDATALEGYARIDDEAQKRIDNITRKWKESFGQVDTMDMSSVAAFAVSMNAIVAVQADAEQQRQRLHRQTMESLKKEEELAARDSLPPWQAAELAIVDTYQDRVTKARQALNTQQIDQQEYNATIVAASAVAQAQMVKQMQQTRDQLGAQLQSFFSNPEKYIEKRAMDTAFQFMANEMTQVFQKNLNNPVVGGLGWLFGMNGPASTSTNPETFGKSLLGMGGNNTGAAGMTAFAQASTSTNPETFGKSLLGMGGNNTGAAGMTAFAQAGTTLTTAGGTLTTASSTLLTAATALQTAVSSMGVSGGFAGGGGGGGFSGFGGSDSGLGGGSAGSSSVSMDSGSGGGGGGYYVGSDLSLSDSATSTASGLASTGSAATNTAAAAGGGAAGKYLGAAGGAIAGGIGVFDAYQNSDPLSGAVSGAELGASVGSIIPGVGTLAGAIVGGIAGLFAGIFGDQGKGKAQDYDSKTVQPGIATELQQYNSGTTGYDQASQYLNQLETSAQQQTQVWGRGATNWYQSHILAEIQAAQLQIDTEEKNGRSLVTMSAAQYHTGGWIGDFGSMGTSSTEGFIHAAAGEFMVHSAAASANAGLLQAINSGRSVTPAAAMGSRMIPSGSGSGSGVTIQAWDGSSVDRWLRNGGALKIRQAGNTAVGQYGGYGIR